MPQTATIEDRISQSYQGLTGKLRVAADYVAEHPMDVATRSLRSVARSSGVSPATFSRLARALGYDDYEALREDGRASVGRKLVPFSERAQSLLAEDGPKDGASYLHRQARACIANIELLDQGLQPGQLEAAVDALHRARTVLVVGSLGSHGFADYLAYLAQWFSPNWAVAGRAGAPMASATSRLGPEDVVLVVTKAPYARRSMLALTSARAKGAATIVITDSHASPALAHAEHGFIVPTESPQFFSSYTATLVLMETLVSMLLARRGAGAEELIRRAEAEIRDLGETWADD